MSEQLGYKELIIGLIFFSLALFIPALHAQGYAIAPAPDWVEPEQTPTLSPLQLSNYSNGVAYLLLDSQWRVSEGQQERFRHYSTKALNSSGVDDISQISIDFDPAYQAVTLHQVSVHRNGEIHDRLERSRFSLLQREKDLEYLIYDGTKTLNVFIEDVRIGDVVEYSYTVSGSNPVLSGHFSEQLNLRWRAPVSSVNYRILWASSKPLHMHKYQTDLEPAKVQTAGTTEYTWRLKDVTELMDDQNTPGWYDPFPTIYLSDIDNWREVTEWARPLYAALPATPAQLEITAPIVEATQSDEQRLLAALKFVQNEVRYLGIELGARSYQPNTPDAVLNQRFGDCKDKSRLLVSLLSEMGIKSSVALVNTNNGALLDQALPTPTAFDHAIVLAVVNGKNYWLDPTRSNQGGDVFSLYQPDYDYALVVSGQGASLTKMSDDTKALHRKSVEEMFFLPDSNRQSATYKIETYFERFYADSFREQMSETNTKQLAQTYLNYTARLYPTAQFTGELTIDDNTLSNRIRVNEQYIVPEIWKLAESEKHLTAEFQPFLMNDHLKVVTDPKRTMPLALTHPVRFRHSTLVYTPENSYFEDEDIAIQDMAFQYTKKVRFRDGLLHIEYIYKSLDDHVKPENIQAYAQNVRDALNLSYYQIQKPNTTTASGEESTIASDPNWPLIVFFIICLVIIMLLSYRYIYLYDPPYIKTSETDPQLAGLSGWLLLVALIVTITPFRLAFESADLLDAFSYRTWNLMSEQLGFALVGLVAAEIVFNAALIVTMLFIAVLFFTQRHTFPKIFIGYLVISFFGSSLDLLVFHLLEIPEFQVTTEEIVELARFGFTSLIWSLYMLKSKRVKATFYWQRGSRKSDETSVPAGAITET
ncbi:MAG: DUF3857 domain-containing protein [Candidatus Sedimenticola sp. 6PFRAG7]